MIKLSRCVVNGAIVLFCLSFSGAKSAVIHVPDDHSTIQEAVNAACDGDTIIVRPGTYVENIDFLWTSLTLKSEKGSEVTVIDGNQNVSALTIHSGPGVQLVVDGFTVTNGAGQKRWTHQGYYRYGGGIYCGDNCSPTITNCVIVGNTALGTRGSGGGIFCEFSSPIISNCVITGNASDSGGGIGCWDSFPAMTNNTIYGNSASQTGGGMECGASAPLILNTIFCKNTAPTGNELWIGSTAFPSSSSLAYCNVEGGQASVYVDPGCLLFWGPGMIDADPLFVNPLENDFHLTFDSPCRNKGGNAAPGLPATDREGDPRAAEFFVDIGADEFHPHLYTVGRATPGGTIQLRIVGEPGLAPVRLVTGSGFQFPPRSTRFGALYLAEPLWYCDVGIVPQNGVLSMPRSLPGWWSTGEEHVLQALIGPLTDDDSLLTNPAFLFMQ